MLALLMPAGLVHAVWRALRRDQRGAGAVEFALVSPVMFLMMLGSLDVGLRVYVRSVLEGELAKAGRDSSLQTAASGTNQTALDTRVQNMVRNVVNSATVTFSRTAFSSYARVQSRAEPFVDGNADGVCNNGEAYEDSNGNGSWDLDSGVSGAGNASDALLYEVTVSYPSFFPLNRMLGRSSNVTFSAKTILKNQPYADATTIATRSCT